MHAQGQNGDTGIHYVKATEVSSMPENKHRNTIQVWKWWLKSLVQEFYDVNLCKQ